MKKITTFIFALMIFSVYGYSQISHNFTVYSEDGLEFTLIVNGQKVNETPQSNVTLVNTNNNYVNVKIIFKNSDLPSIKRKNIQIAYPEQGNNTPVATVYKIKEKKGKYKLRFVSRSDKKIQANETIIIKDEKKSNFKIKVGGVEISK